MKFAALMMAAVVSLFAAENDRKADDLKRIQAATSTLVDVQHAKDGGVPQDLLQRARCVGVIPATKNVAFLLGGQYGKGIVTCRINDTNRWSAPAFIVLEGGTIGLQAGVAETDVVFTLMNRHAQQRIETEKVEIGANVKAAAGPIGRSISAGTNAWMRDEMLSWSRARGVFAGVDLKGGSLRLDKDDDAALYGAHVTAGEILDGKTPAPAEAHALHRELERYAHKAPVTGE